MLAAITRLLGSGMQLPILWGRKRIQAIWVPVLPAPAVLPKTEGEGSPVASPIRLAPPAKSGFQRPQSQTLSKKIPSKDNMASARPVITMTPLLTVAVL